MTFGEQNTEKEAHQILSYAFDHGINILDTAEAVSAFLFIQAFYHLYIKCLNFNGTTVPCYLLEKRFLLFIHWNCLNP